ncbi:MAG TPA: hypothetical protein VFU80_00695 [Sphingomicrobium sp.]|nr:hypothetical protein [Sphingomicrobium sp.]
MTARPDGNRKQLQPASLGIALSAALLGLLVSTADNADARGFGGGGFRGGGSMSMSRGGGLGHGSRGSFDRGSLNRGSSDRGRYNDGGTFSRSGNYSRPSALERSGSGRHVDGGETRSTDFGIRSNPNGRPGAGDSGTRWDAGRPGGGGSATQLPATRPGGGGSGAQLPANRPDDGGSGVRWRPLDRPGDGGSGTQWRPDCPKCSDGGGWIDHPVAAGIAIGAIAGATAAAIGSTWYALPPECPPYYWNNTLYYTCDGAYYLPQYEGDTIVYVSVPDPSVAQPPKEGINP